MRLYHKEWSCFNGQHMCHFRNLSKLGGFSGTILPGQNLSIDAVANEDDGGEDLEYGDIAE
jgi:hypothetical protein